jgi:hypothetical protein
VNALFLFNAADNKQKETLIKASKNYPFISEMMRGIIEWENINLIDATQLIDTFLPVAPVNTYRDNLVKLFESQKHFSIVNSGMSALMKAELTQETAEILSKRIFPVLMNAKNLAQRENIEIMVLLYESLNSKPDNTTASKLRLELFTVITNYLDALSENATLMQKHHKDSAVSLEALFKIAGRDYQTALKGKGSKNQPTLALQYPSAPPPDYHEDSDSSDSEIFEKPFSPILVAKAPPFDDYAQSSGSKIQTENLEFSPVQTSTHEIETQTDEPDVHRRDIESQTDAPDVRRREIETQTDPLPASVVQPQAPSNPEYVNLMGMMTLLMTQAEQTRALQDQMLAMQTQVKQAPAQSDIDTMQSTIDKQASTIENLRLIMKKQQETIRAQQEQIEQLQEELTKPSFKNK